MLADRLYDAMTATFDLLAVYVGERLGWYAALAEGPRREWLPAYRLN